ncbi:hypothetical protein EJ08DRAFT_368066 [Tothia fuscella]|uniref:Uncharacterized protein n=1 Tax=Tothia fuscella TaxID=1048955 RepID=A0A9P4NL43_9PEZI|nr:hypothetical protein EJ08DRAFT_368066 [Tothia fuscella]
MATPIPTPEPVSTRGMKNQVRIRGPKPDVSFPCNSLNQMERLLAEHIEKCHDGRLIPETVYAQFIFDSAVVLEITDLSDGIRDHFPHLAAIESQEGTGTLTVPAAVAPADDAKTKLRRQRAVGRVILKSISKVDGFNYSEKEAWDTKHADGYRFKYLCRDSLQNKERSTSKKDKGLNASAVVPPPGTEVSIEQSPSNGKLDIAKIPSNDCKGSIFVKFSQSQQILDVVYQHFPVHQQAPSNGSMPGSRSDVPSELNGSGPNDSGDPMETTEGASFQPLNSIPHNPFAAITATPVKVKKRKRTAKPVKEIMAEIDSSEVYAEDDYDMDDSAPPLPLVDPNFEPNPDDADFYRPSVVTLVPGQKAPPKKQAARPSYHAASEGSSSGSAYEGKHLKKKQAQKVAPKPKQKAAAVAAVG